MRVLITGGAGFIGSHVADVLLQAGHEVAILDDLSTGSLDNLQQALGRSGCRFVQGRVESSADLAPLMVWCDQVIHLAAAVGVDLVVKSPVHTIETNIHGTEQVFQLAAHCGRRVIAASTSEVYGKANAPTFVETDDLVIGPPTHYRWSYAASKALDEYLAFAYAKEKGLHTVIARFFNTVGPRQTGRYGMVLPRFVQQALAGQPVRVFGDGEQTRCFCHVFDTVHALLLLLDCPAADNEIFNIGSPSQISINDLARRVIELAGSGSAIEHVSYEEAYAPGFEDMRRRVPDIGKIRTLTGWQPARDLDTIIRDVIREFRTQAG
jgi:UDP-glucose 4-epimerase